MPKDNNKEENIFGTNQITIYFNENKFACDEFISIKYLCHLN